MSPCDTYAKRHTNNTAAGEGLKVKDDVDMCVPYQSLKELVAGLETATIQFWYLQVYVMSQLRRLVPQQYTQTNGDHYHIQTATRTLTRSVTYHNEQRYCTIAR